MNAVARVFVVLTLILAAGFLMAAGTFLHQQQTNEEAIESLRVEKEAEIKGLQGDLEV